MFLLIQPISEQSKALWGKMNVQQMLEHLTDFFNVSVEKIIFPLVTPEEFLPKYRQFLYSEKKFKENTKAPEEVLGEEPLPLRSASLQEAKDKLQKTVEYFFHYFETNVDKKTMHPAFGQLNFEEWVLLHYKHVTHHLRQFKMMP
jgi:oxepin-CoA hydrolase/3-oxo-5,6-dehydrosuberyl-CoA semialdehyde dehydrogenase